MNLKIANVGKVKLASIAINGITVVAGDNGAGKSTLGRCLTTYANAMRQMDSLVRNRRISKFISAVVSNLGLSEFAEHYLTVYAYRNAESVRILSPESWSSPEKVRQIVTAAASIYQEEKLVQKKLEEKPIDANGIVRMLQDINNEPFSWYVQQVLDDCFRSSFKKQISPLADIDAKGYVTIFESDESEDAYKVGFESNKVISIPSEIRYQFPPVIYFEPLHALDFGVERAARPFWGFPFGALERYGAGDLDLDSIIANREFDVKYENENEKKAVFELVEDLIEIIRGKMEEVDKSLMFKERFNDGNSAFVELGNLASGAKTMSVVIHALRNGSLRRNRMLVVDEPESNLHPDWQVKFAHSLVLLHKRLGIKVLLNTHSPYFLKAIEYYAEKEKVDGVTNCYLMKKEKDGPLYNVEDCTGNTNVIFNTMYEPFKEIM